MPIDNSNEQETESWECVGCSYTYHDDERLGFEGSRGKVCDDCARTCGECSVLFNINSGSLHAFYNDEAICYRCTSTFYVMCSRCDDWEHRQNSVGTVHDGRICDSCYDGYYYICDECDGVFHHDDDHNHEDARIQSYDYRPDPIFHHTDAEFDNATITVTRDNVRLRKYRRIAYMGFELEVESLSYDHSDGARLFDDYDNLIYLKHDGSLNCGFEIVTHPMTLDWAMSNFPFKTLEDLRDEGYKAWNTDTAGLHVHVSKDGFTGVPHMARFINLITRNEALFTALAGRSESRWAQFNNGNTRNLRAKLLRIDNNVDRYSAVNVRNTNTLEVRIFRASLKPERIKMALQLVDACVNYTQPDGTTLTDQLDAGKFVNWVHKNKDRYSDLASYVSYENGVFSVQDKE